MEYLPSFHSKKLNDPTAYENLLRPLKLSLELTILRTPPQKTHATLTQTKDAKR